MQSLKERRDQMCTPRFSLRWPWRRGPVGQMGKTHSETTIVPREKTVVRPDVRGFSLAESQRIFLADFIN